jgi:uncharacterized protein (TIGR00255 family)
MIYSMTGYGEAQGELNGVSYAVEIKTVNNRYFKVIIKLPELVSFLEDDVEKLLRHHIARGTVNYVLRLKDASADVLFDIDEKALQAVVARLHRIQVSAGVSGAIDLGNLLSIPGIIRPASPDQSVAKQIRQKVLQTSSQAIAQLQQMRATEGSALRADLDKYCSEIKNHIEHVRLRSSTVVLEYAKRLKKRVDELLAHAELKLDEEMLTREVAIFADRSDVSEELARLDSHLQQFEAGVADQDIGQAGRRLDFISQEMLREANTIASKALDVEIVRRVVDMKCHIDRIKEQVQNIE